MKRYFIVFYMGTGRAGNFPLTSHDGTYPALLFLADQTEIECGVRCAITNIIELTEQDYLDWVK